MSSHSDLHDYIHGVLETGDHGPYRIISFDLPALNDAIEKHAKRIARSIESDVKKTLPGDQDKVTLKNHLGNVSFQAIPSTPSNLDDLRVAMANAKREKLNVKAIGGFYAFSPICETTGYAIKTDNLVGTSPTPTTTLKDAYKTEGLYDIICGTAFKQVIQILEKDGRALMNLGGFTGQGTIGATATGTHGSGLTIPPLASMIRSINLVSAQFDPSGLPIQYQIEPTNGITDPKRHSASSVLIQDDKMFNAVMTGLGATGVIYSVTVATVPFYWVRELREMVKWPAARELLEQGPQGSILKYHNAEVWVNPYTSLTLLTRREKVTTPPAGELAGPSFIIYATLVKQLPALHTVLHEILDGSIIEDIMKWLGIILGLLLRFFPLLVPTVIDLAMHTQNHSEPKVAKYYDIYDIGFANYFPAISTEISYPMASNLYLSATESTISLLQQLRKGNIHKAVTAPLALRFTASTPANLSMSYNINPSDTLGRCYIEMPSLFYFYKSIQGYEDISRPHSEESINKFQGRLHWGQYISPSFTALQYKPHDPDFYESIVSFRAVAEKFDPGHMTANEFLTKVIWLVPGI